MSYLSQQTGFIVEAHRHSCSVVCHLTTWQYCRGRSSGRAPASSSSMAILSTYSTVRLLSAGCHGEAAARHSAVASSAVYLCKG